MEKIKNQSTEKENAKQMKNMIMIFSIFVLLISCGKEEDATAKIIGKWYHASKDTKIARPPACMLKDTTENYTKDNSSMIYEFFADGKMIVTSKVGGQSYTSEAKYSLESNKMTWIFNGQSSPPITVSNLDGSN